MKKYIHKFFLDFKKSTSVCLFALIFCTQTAYAQTVITAAFDTFAGSNINLFQLNNDASANGSNLQLTPGSGGLGSAFFNKKVTLLNNRSFSAYFDFAIDNGACFGPDISADGLAFVIQTVSNSAGSAGGGIGYMGITPSIAVEFDTFDNGAGDNSSGNHIGLAINGDVDTALTTGVATNIADPFDSQNPDPTVNKGVWIDYNGTTSTIEIRYAPWSGASRPARPASADVTYTFTNGSTPADLFSQDVFVGFSAATGGCTARHQILSFFFNNDLVSGSIRPTDVSYASAPASVLLNASPSSISAGQTTSNLTATVLNISNTPVPNEVVTFTTNLGLLSSATQVTDSNGQAQVTLQSNSIGTANIRASVNGGAFSDAAVVVNTPLPTATPTATPTLTPTPAPTIDACPLPAPGITKKGNNIRVNFSRKSKFSRDYRIIIRKTNRSSERRTKTKVGKKIPFFKNVSKGNWEAFYIEIRNRKVEVCSQKKSFVIR